MPSPDNSSDLLSADNNAGQVAGFWNNKYQQNKTGWDLGSVSPPIKAYADQLENKNLRILIPGCGNSYEAQYLASLGFTNITLIDIATEVVQKLQQQFRNSPAITILEGDFFQHEGQYDLILEQTFFCALNPALRPAYAEHMHRLLASDGRIVGVLFDRIFDKPGPPFGGSREEYQALFAPWFTLKVFEPCLNSAAPRQGTELFVVLQKK